MVIRPVGLGSTEICTLYAVVHSCDSSIQKVGVGGYPEIQVQNERDPISIKKPGESQSNMSGFFKTFNIFYCGSLGYIGKEIDQRES